ncbi:bifunctional DNA primase/polymerase [Bremerella sp. JC770]|uniref:bifunctional DNA primase/polymerase n=1 Tax=Bremerella sp. JC770 TaxID=3232137 RepID=UPI0034599775
MSNCKQEAKTSATTFDNNCVALAEDGVKFVVLHGLNDGKCTCFKGSECPSPGKHPVRNGWDKHATDDSEFLDELFEKNPTRNLGILIGPQSGIIDIEFDDDIGRETAERLFRNVETVAYKSGRSVHRLFKHSSRLPDVQKIEPKTGTLAGLEIRIGGGNAATQSVAPPSLHHSGTHYEWLPGCDPISTEVADIPRDVLGAITNFDPVSDRAEYKPNPSVLRVAFGEAIGEGERNDTLFKYACSQAEVYGERLCREDYQRRFAEDIHSRNQYQFKPPLPDNEVQAITGQAIRYELRGLRDRGVTPEEAAESQILSDEKSPWMGLIHDAATGAVKPGTWTLYRVKADPIFYELHIPEVADMTPSKNGRVQIPLDDIFSASRVANHILKGTEGRFSPLDMPGNWNGIWNGKAAKKGDTGAIGLVGKLRDRMEDIGADPFDERWRALLEYLLGKLNGAYKFSETKSTEGRVEYIISEGCYDQPHKHPDGSAWFKWDPIWMDARSKNTFTEEEIRKLRRMIGIVGKGRKPHRYEKRDTWAKSTSRFIVFPRKKLDQLQALLDQ